MSKTDEEIISDFNINTNMSVDELEGWLKNPKSKEAGTGVGIESGHKIVDILKKNPDKDPQQYDEEDIKHMRKVVNYDKRHLAQEDHLKQTKSKEELENTKSTKSLKNWGHDPVKTLDDQEGSRGEGNTQEVAGSDRDSVDVDTTADNDATLKPSIKRKHADTEGETDEADNNIDEIADVKEADTDEEKPSATKKTRTDPEEEDGKGDEVQGEEV